MIKCNVSIIGTISRKGEIKTDKEGNQFFSFGLKTNLPTKEASVKPLEISVAKSGSAEDLANLNPEVRVQVKGTMILRKKNDVVYYNLSASEIDLNIEGEDRINGTLVFRGTTGNKEIIDKQGKTGPYRVFDAYSSEKTDDNRYTYTWIHFIDFNTEHPQWLQPKTGIDVEGELELTVFNNRESINCRVSTLSFWDKNNSKQI